MLFGIFLQFLTVLYCGRRCIHLYTAQLYTAVGVAFIVGLPKCDHRIILWEIQKLAFC